VAHLADGTLRRMVDDPDAQAASDARHLEECVDCRSRLDTIAGDAHAIEALLAVPAAKVDVARALKRVGSTPAARPAFGFRLPMLPPLSRPVQLGFAAVVAAVALIVVAVASNGGLFVQPSTITPVPVTVADMQSLSELSAYGTITWTTQPTPQIVTSAAEAQSISGLKPPVVSSLPKGVSSNVTYAAMPQAVAVFTFDANKAAAAAATSGKPLPRLPAGLDGAKLTVTIGPAVAEIYGNLKQPSGSDISQADLPQLMIARSSVPTAASTQVSVKQLESYLLSMPGISANLKSAIQAIGDPSTTLPVPIPVGFATSTKVQVQGVQGLALGDNTGLGSGVIWVKHGSVYAVAGTIKQSDAINIANNLS
jgi:hypothetical protein